MFATSVPKTLNYTNTLFDILSKQLEIESWNDNQPCVMPSTRKQKAKEMRSGQSHVMSDNENMDVTLGNVPGIALRE